MRDGVKRNIVTIKCRRSGYDPAPHSWSVSSDLVERWIENPCVEGSIPSQTTSKDPYSNSFENMKTGFHKTGSCDLCSI